MSANLVIRSRADAPYLSKAASAIEQAAWSNLGFLNYTRAHYEYYAELLDENVREAYFRAHGYQTAA